MTRRFAKLVGLAAALALAAAGGAERAAGEPLASCPGQALERPFLPWLDPAWYVLVPDGGLEEGGRGWTLARGARVVLGNEPFHVRAPGDARSLLLPSGSAATTPWLCVGIEHPTFRLFVRSGSPLSLLAVDVLVDDGSGGRKVATIPVTATLGWQPTLPTPLLASAGALPLVGDGAVRVALRFRTAGEWSVDDVYVDPFKGT